MSDVQAWSAWLPCPRQGPEACRVDMAPWTLPCFMYLCVNGYEVHTPHLRARRL